VVKEILVKKRKAKALITTKTLERYLGVQRYRFGLAEEHSQVGQVNGLAWTEVGGELLTIEAAAIPGKGKTTYTGHLGDIMQESIQAAMTVVRSRAENLHIPLDFYEKYDIHVHVPEGATPKDGPSAGIGMCTALVSALTKVPVRADVALTGEITLRGEVLPIGGLKEKLLAALRAGVKQVIIPKENQRELKEIPKNILDGLQIHPVRWIDEVLTIALEHEPLPRAAQEAEQATTETIIPTKTDKKTEDKRESAH
jgi:ATP-dependent Lon protease